MPNASGSSVRPLADGQSNASYKRVMRTVTGFGITQDEVSKAVGAAVRTVQTWASGDNKPTGVKARRLLDVQTIGLLLGDVYTNEGIGIWLHSRNRNLGLRRPIDLLTEGHIDEVLNEAETLAGGYS